MTYGNGAYGNIFYGGGYFAPSSGSVSAALSASVQVAFQNNPFDTSLTWTDITKYVLQFSSTMGRQHELQQVNPSTANIVLTNQDGRFSPWNSGGPYYFSGTGQRPGHPVRILSAAFGTTYNVFYGYAKGWVPSYGMSKATMTLQCYDILALLNLNTMDADGYSILPESSALDYWPLTDPLGSGTVADDASTNPLTPLGAAYPGAATGPLLNQPGPAVQMLAGGYLAGGTNGGVSASVGAFDGWFQTTNKASSNTFYDTGGYLAITTQTTTGYAQIAVLSTPTASNVNVCDGKWHYLALTLNNPNVSLYVDGQLATSASIGLGVPLSSIQIGLGTNSASVAAARCALYPSLTSAEIASQYAIGTAGFVVQDSGSRANAVLELAGVPAELNNVGTGNIQCQSATSSLATTTAMSYLNTVTNTERGLLYQDAGGVVQFRNRHYVYENPTSNTSQATFGYSPGQYHYFSTGLVPGEDDLDLWNNIPVQRTGGVIQTASDSTSQTAYGRRTLTGYTSLLFTNDADSYGLASGLLYQYKQPAARVRSITMDSTINDGANLPQMLGRQLLDRITINWRPIDGTGVDFSQQSLIEQVTHTVTPEVWTTTFAVTPIGTEEFFILGTSQLGTGILGF